MSKWYYYCIILSILFAVLQFSNSKSGKIDNYEYHYDDDSVSEKRRIKRNYDYDYDITGSGFNYEYDYNDRKYYRKDYNRSALAESGEEFDAYVYYDRKYILLPQNGEDTKESKFMHNYILWTK